MNASIVNADGTPAGPLTAGQRRLWSQAFRSIGFELVFDHPLVSEGDGVAAGGAVPSGETHRRASTSSPSGASREPNGKAAQAITPTPPRTPIRG